MLRACPAQNNLTITGGQKAITYTFSTHDHNKNTVWCTASTKKLFFDFMQYVLDNSNNPAAYTIVENETGKAANLETIAAYYNMIANYEKAICEKPSRVVPITFENESEKFLVLPVNLKDFDASVRSLETILAF